MKCDQIQPLINDYIDETLPADQAESVRKHCLTCENCSHDIEVLAMQKVLIKSLSVPRASTGFEKRAIDTAILNAHAQQESPFKQHSYYKAAAAVMFFALVLWLGVFNDSTVTDNALTLVSVGDEIQTIKLAIDSEQDLEAVSLQIELSDNLELAGFGNKKQINWTTGLRQGVNVISLPVVGIAQGKGDITTRIRLNGKEKVMHINTQYKLPGNVLFEYGTSGLS